MVSTVMPVRSETRNTVRFIDRNKAPGAALPEVENLARGLPGRQLYGKRRTPQAAGRAMTAEQRTATAVQRYRDPRMNDYVVWLNELGMHDVERCGKNARSAR